MNNNKKMLFGIILSFVFLLSTGLTYAYFTLDITGNEEAKLINVSTGTLEIHYTDGQEISMFNVRPGASITKTMKVENIGSFDAAYNIGWQDLNNEILNEELKISFECTSYEYETGTNNLVETETNTCIEQGTYVIGTSTTPSITAAIPIEIGITHIYNVTVEFIETNENQNYNQDKNFYGELEIRPDVEVTNIAGQLLNNGIPIANATIRTHSTPLTTTTDAEGNFTFLGIEYGQHTLEVLDSEDNVIATDTFEINKIRTTSVIENNKVIKWNPIDYENKNIIIDMKDSLINYIVFDVESTSENCFAFNSEEKTITNYYTHENDNPEDPICPRIVSIPAQIGGINVEAIGNSAFATKEIDEVHLPNGIINIWDGAFCGNNLSSISIPNTVTKITLAAFEDNDLISVDFSNSLEEIGIYAFSTNALTTINIPDSVTNIGPYSFADNDLISVDIPNSVNIIEYDAFSNNNLTTVTIPESVNNLDCDVFDNNPLNSVYIKGKNTSSDFSRYCTYYEVPHPDRIFYWASDITCIPNNTSNVTNGCITWNAQ